MTSKSEVGVQLKPRPEEVPEKPQLEEATEPAVIAPEQVAPERGRFGPLGKPLNRRSPFFVGFTGALGVLLAWAVYQALTDMWSILMLVGISAFLAVGLNPAVQGLQSWRIPRGLAVAIVALGAFGFIAALVFALVPPIVSQATDFVANVPNYIEALRENSALRDLDERYHILEKIEGGITGETATQAVGGVLGGIGLVLGAVFNILTCIILTIYFLAAFNRIKAGAYKLFPASRRQRAQLLGDEMLFRIGRYLSGALVIAAVAGTAAFGFMTVAGVPYAFALALVVAMTDLIPQIGATLGAVVVTVVAFFVSVPVGIASIIFFIAYQQLENWVIYPRVMRKAVNVSDLAAIVSALLGAALLGIVGALLAVPICAAVQLIMREIVIPRQEAH